MNCVAVAMKASADFTGSWRGGGLLELSCVGPGVMPLICLISRWMWSGPGRWCDIG